MSYDDQYDDEYDDDENDFDDSDAYVKTTNGYVGDAWQTTDDWSFRTSYGCVASLSLYCFEQ